MFLGFQYKTRNVHHFTNTCQRFIPMSKMIQIAQSASSKVNANPPFQNCILLGLKWNTGRKLDLHLSGSREILCRGIWYASPRLRRELSVLVS